MANEGKSTIVDVKSVYLRRNKNGKEYYFVRLTNGTACTLYKNFLAVIKPQEEDKEAFDTSR